MSKKNNKARKRQYVDKMKAAETEKENERKKKQLQRDNNRNAENLIDEIDNIAINQEKEEKMDVEKKQIVSKRKRRKVYRHKHGRFS